MSEDQATLLASELQSHRYWRVDEVYHMPLTDADGWEIRLQQRCCEHTFMRVVRADNLPRLARMLNEWGCDHRVPCPFHTPILTNV